MLVYRIRNDVPDISDPWWGMIAVGTGTDFPTSPTNLPVGVHFEGPTRDVRAAHYMSLAGPSQSRGTLLSSTGTVVLDVWSGSYGGSMGNVATGRSGLPTACGSGRGDTVFVRSALPVLGFGALPAEAMDCYYSRSGGGADYVTVSNADGNGYMMGDEGIGHQMNPELFRDSTTLVWIRRTPL